MNLSVKKLTFCLAIDLEKQNHAQVYVVPLFFSL